jgi:dynein heavy chain 1
LFLIFTDPSGQATEFILNEYADRKITKTSFLDDSFRKNLESALRFGNPLLVQDAENYDPILNPVLNRELRRTGGRVLITLADQDIDLSPTFTIFLSTRDPTVEFRPDICSRVTMVNFTVTRSSLQMQCLNQVLKAERPDIDKKRSDLLKLQGEFQLRLRHLEKNLLQCLNEAKGRILDDNTVITTLETLKKEAAEVSKKVDETETVMEEIENTSKQYEPLSHACSSIYFTIDNLHQIHFLYQFSLQFFLDIFHSLLTDTALLEGNTDYAKRLGTLTTNLFERAYRRITRGMLHEDKIVFALTLTRIFLKGKGEVNLEEEFAHLLSSSDQDKNIAVRQPQELAQNLRAKLPAFADVASHLSTTEFGTWFRSAAPEDDVPNGLWSKADSESKERESMYQLLAVSAFRKDRFIAAANRFVHSVMGQAFHAESEVDFAKIIEEEVKSTTPVLMCSVLGFDAADRVMDLAAQCNKPITSIAIGSDEGFNQAEKSINTAIKSGRWVLLKNGHLAPSWLTSLEKKLHSIQAHSGFRLFLTCEITPKLPVNLLRAGRIFTFEPPPGIRANLVRTFSSIPAARMMKPPNERARLYFILAWFHAIVQERLRYVPLGWSKGYEFNESDLRGACDMLDKWIDATSKGRTNLPPNKVPWKAIQSLLADVIYGGKIDSEFDQKLMVTFIEKLFAENTFDDSYLLVDAGDVKVKMPDGIRRDQFLAWIEALSDKQSPVWLGLPDTAENVLLTQQGTKTKMKLMRMQQIDDEDDDASGTVAQPETEAGGGNQLKDGRPSWMKTLGTLVKGWMGKLPKSLALLKRSRENIKDPLFRYFDREVKLGSSILNVVRADLEEIEEICSGEKRQTNHHREIGMQLLKGIIPT